MVEWRPMSRIPGAFRLALTMPTIGLVQSSDEQPRIVVIETTGRQGSVAVAAGDEMLGTSRFTADLQHAVELIPAIRRLCESVAWRPEQLDEIYVSAGPGSFTGCRIGITVARALAQAVGVKLVRVPTVDVLACNALSLHPSRQHVVVLLDAQRRQVYAAVFDRVDDAYVRRGELRVGDPAVLLADCPTPCAALGEGIAYHRRTIESRLAEDGAPAIEILPEATWPAQAEYVLRIGRQLARQGAYVPVNELLPIYVRLPEAEERWRARQSNGHQ